LNDFAAALRDLNAAGVRYVIVDGLAVIRHGAVRATKDVDAAVAMDEGNLSRLSALVERWGATNPDGTPLRTTELRPGGALALRSSACFVDILSEQLLPARSRRSWTAPTSSASMASTHRSARSPISWR
jgi:hypothetical protein